MKRLPWVQLASLVLAWPALQAAPAPLTAGPRIEIPHSTGKFDFLAVDSGRRRLLAAHEKDGTADFIDLAGGTVLARIKTGPTVGIALDETTGKYFASVQDDKRVAVIDAETLRETNSIPMDGETDAIVCDREHRRVYVTNDNGKFVWAIDADAQKVVAAIPIPGAPECLALDPAHERLYVNIKATSQVAIVDTRTNTVTGFWSTAPAEAPHGLVLDADHRRLISSGDNGKLVALDLTTGRVTASADIVEKVDQIAFDPSTHQVYCAGPDWMSVVESSAGGLTSLGKVKTAANAKNVAVDPVTHAVWTTFTDGTNSYAQQFHVR